MVARILGDLKLRIGKHEILEDTMRGKHSWPIFCYMLLDSKEYLPMSSITKRIFPNDDSLNLEQSIRTDISRFNKRVKELTGFDLICSSRNMGYRINPELEIITDFDVLQDRMIVASEIKSESGRIRALMDLVNTYRGGLYESHNNEGWVYAFAKGIHGIFLKNAEELLELWLQLSGKFSDRCSIELRQGF